MTDLWERAAQLPPAQQAAFRVHARQTLIRHEAIRKWPTAGAMAEALDPSTVQTPDLRLIDESLEWAFTTPRARLMISKPSQTGKSERSVVWGIPRALVRRPDWRTIVVTHSEDLALTHSERIRYILQTYGTGARDAMSRELLPDRLGIRIGAKSAASRWQLAGQRGGLVAAGVGTALPGRPADAMWLDDLFSGMAAADSAAQRRTVRLWWDTVGSQRLGPEAPLIVIGTRWNEEDMHAYLLEVEPGPWRILNFPAIAEPGILDSLNRPHGEFLQNPRGYTDWARLRESKPARVWAAMYQGHPTPSDGTLFSQAWFDKWRLPSMPVLYRKIVAIDPAETGRRDEVGIIAAGLDAYGAVVYTDDASGQYSAADWPRRALLLALHTGATEVYFEGYTAAVTYENTLKRTYEDLVVEAAANGGYIDTEWGPVRVPEVRPFLIASWTGKGDAVVRSSGWRNSASTGWARMVQQRMATLEFKARTWQEGQHCPDRVAAGTIAFDVLYGANDGGMSGSAESWGSMSDGIAGR